MSALETGVAAGLRYRPVTPDELEACAHVWRHAIDDYIVRIGQPALPEEVGPLVRLYRHLQSTDPDRFVAALRDTPAGDEIVGFGAAVVRGSLWYLSMLFVLPGLQGAGIGRALLDRIGPRDGDGVTFRGTATDSAQPISNAMYASLGIVPRIPLLNLVGTPTSLAPFGDLPTGVRALSFEELVAGPPDGDGQGHRRLAEAVDDLDADLLGATHPLDHRWLRTEGRHGWLYIGPDGHVLGYGYASELGRVGPVAVHDAALLAPVVGHLLGAIQPRGAHAIWLPGSADRVIVAALAAGLRLEAFPLLLCWDQPFGDWSRYVPISPGLL